MVEILINNGAYLEYTEPENKDTALSTACNLGYHAIVKLLLKAKANVEHRNLEDLTPLYVASRSGDLVIMELLLKYGADIEARTGNSNLTPLMDAVVYNQEDSVEFLLQHNCDVNSTLRSYGFSALSLACRFGYNKIVDILLAYNAYIEYRSENRLTPLMEAAAAGHFQIVQTLIESGANVNARPTSVFRETALTFAAQNGHFECIRVLLNSGANIDVINREGNSAIWLAACHGHLRCVELLYENKADIDAQNYSKATCLMAAFCNGYTDVVNYMLTLVQTLPRADVMQYYVNSIEDDVLKLKCYQSMDLILKAREERDAKLNLNARTLLQEFEYKKRRREAISTRREKIRAMKNKMIVKELIPKYPKEPAKPQLLSNKNNDNKIDDKNN